MKSWFWLAGLNTEHRMTRTSWPQAGLTAEALNWERGHISVHKQKAEKANWKWDKAKQSQNLSLVTYFLQQASHPKWSITSLNSATNWRQGVQIHEPLGDISYSKHRTYCVGSYIITKCKMFRNISSPWCIFYLSISCLLLPWLLLLLLLLGGEGGALQY